MSLKSILFFVMMLVSSLSLAQENVKNFEGFKSIPILHEGRIKPLDTYARNLLIQFSGKDSCEHTSAIVWLSRVLFDAAKTKDDKIFLINHPDVLTALNIPSEVHRRYSFAQIEKVFPKLIELHEAAIKIPEKERSLVENEILRLSDNIQLYVELVGEFAWSFTNEDFTLSSKDIKSKLGLDKDQNQFSFIDIALKAKEIQNFVFGLSARKTKDQVTPEDVEVMRSIKNLYLWSKRYQDLPLNVIPSSKNKGWLSPWDAISNDFSNEKTRQLIGLWQKIVVSYNRNNSEDFNQYCILYSQALREQLPKAELTNVNKFPLELIYHAINPFLWAKIFYICSFICFVISFSSNKPIVYNLGLSSVFLGFGIHTIGLIARIIIMARPPVTNLYETFIFVGFITVFLGLLIEHFNRQWLGMVTASISGAVLLFIAGKYAAEGDTLKMLVAVLNSNFWLGTHVITITMGYGATCVAGVLGHIWLLQAALKKDKLTLEKTYNTILGILGLALALTFLGTNLGGIWADQSWGRYWGWDPKENGALMIVLWITILFHAKFSKMIGPLGLAVGTVIGMIVVMWAWFGVNLLSIGLHSYGFTSGIAMSLAIYVICEIIYLLITTLSISRK